MWLIALISILDACLNNNVVNSSYLRLEIAHLPLNVFDLLLFAALIWSLLPSGTSYVRTGHVDKTFIWAMVLFVLAIVFGIIGSVVDPDAQSRQIITAARNFIMVPISIFVGYRCTKNLSSGLFYCYAVLVAGILVAIIVPLDFATASESLHREQSIESVRIIQYIANYAGMVGALLIFCLGFPAKPLLPRWMCVVLAGICCVGQCATLSRSDWAGLAAGLVAALAIMPLYSVRRKIMTGLIALPVIFAFIIGGIFVAEKVSGREMFHKMTNRLISMLPGEHTGIKSAADTRLAGTYRELEFWSQSPVWGKGFVVQDTAALTNSQDLASGFRHDTWTSTLAETGLIGFSAMAVMCFGQIIVGWKMVRGRFDRRSMLVGALGAVTGAHFVIHGLCTMSFNVMRPAIPVAITFGVVLRTRAIERAMREMYDGYLPDPAQTADSALPLMDALGPPAYVHTPASPWAGGMREADFASY